MANRDNFGRFQKNLTVNIQKHLLKQAEALRTDIELVVADKLEETHKANVVASYIPRAQSELAKVEYNKNKKVEEMEDRKKQIVSRRSRKTLSYRHTGTLEEAIHSEIEHKNRYESKIKIVIEGKEYEDSGHRKNGPVKATQVYKWLKNGTDGGSRAYWFTDKNGDRPDAVNYPTPPHPFEEHTIAQMRSFLSTLDIKHYSRMKRYKRG